MKKKLSCYLAGAIQHADDLGSGWRKEITPFLEKLGLAVLNPIELEADKLKGLHVNRLPDFYTDLHGNKIKPLHWHELSQASEQHLYKRFLKYMRRIIHFDIDIVEKETNYIICLWDQKTAKGAGTHAELTTAFRHNKPIYCVAKTKMPAWAKACCTEIFLSFTELKDFLKEEFDYDETLDK